MASPPRPGPMSALRWSRLADPAAIARTACERILACASEAIALHGRFALVLAGGSTPAATYARLASCDADWHHWHLYFGDERCLPSDDPGRNSQLVARQLSNRVPIPPNQVHPIPAELGAPRGAQRYTETLKGVPPFDLVLLGVGADGHTASLFPEQRHPSDVPVIPVFNAPKPPAERISLNYTTLGNCRQLLIMVSGSGKRDAVRRWRKGNGTLPVSLIAPIGEGEVLIDQSAWPDNDSPAD